MRRGLSAPARPERSGGGTPRQTSSTRFKLPGDPLPPSLRSGTLPHSVVEGKTVASTTPSLRSLRPHGLEEFEEGLRNIFLGCGDEELRSSEDRTTLDTLKTHLL